MYNSDGYVLLDMAQVDISLSSQHIAGMFDRIVNGINNTNKLVIVINVSDYLPMAATIRKVSNYYEIITELYIFKVNSNDIVITQENAGSFSEVTIIPALFEGDKIADFTIGGVSGVLYSPKQESEINDTVASDQTTYSSNKITNLINGISISELSDIGDVEITLPTNEQILAYDAINSKWINANKPSGANVDILSPINVSSKVSSIVGSCFKLGKILFLSLSFSNTEDSNNKTLFTLENINVANDYQYIYLSNNNAKTIKFVNNGTDIDIKTGTSSLPGSVYINCVVLLA